MSNHNKIFEIVVAAIGVIVAAILGFGQLQIANQQSALMKMQMDDSEKRGKDNIEVQVMNMISTYFIDLGSEGEKGKRSEIVVLAAAEFLSKEHERYNLATMAAEISKENSEISEQAKLRFKEASKNEAGKKAAYFTVLASLPGDDLDKARRNALKKKGLAKTVGINQKVSIYKTQISNNYAVVIGGKQDRDSAAQLAREAREKSLASDSFPQIDKNWTLIENVN